MSGPLRGGPRGDAPRELRLRRLPRPAVGASPILRRWLAPGETFVPTPVAELRALAPEAAWRPPVKPKHRRS
jgi:hypothetical protein